jgi:NitT/TauT family transport system permease protein
MAEGRLRALLLPAGVMVAITVLWQLAYWVFRIPTFVVPAPLGIIAETWEWRWRLLGHTGVTLYETLAGFALSIVIGTPLAVVIVYSPLLRRAIYPLLVVAQAVPKVAIAPVLLLLLGAGEVSKVVVAFLVAFFPVVVDTATGLAATPPELLDLSRSYRASALKTFAKVRFPMALPFFFSGLKVAVTLAVIGAVGGEFVGSDKGWGMSFSSRRPTGSRTWPSGRWVSSPFWPWASSGSSSWSSASSALGTPSRAKAPRRAPSEIAANLANRFVAARTARADLPYGAPPSRPVRNSPGSCPGTGASPVDR